ncbi:MAG: hypothetical protein BGO98_18960 [Myxococcales bacterium 68-20]|nr:SRPBCC domain-containing protein [Myxococcales bacterium]OJY24714.1 MAG: hypothetical protein BGO98_18960 [Myxococcales bacterium 68-20]
MAHDSIARPPMKHETLVFERRFRSSPRAVFAAYADVEARARWSAPSDATAVVYSVSDFRVDGVDRFRCGDKTNLQFEGTVRYADIVENERIVYSEVISTTDMKLSVSLVTWEIVPDQTGSRLVVTDQIASFVGDDMIAGSRVGMNAALDNLVALLERAPVPERDVTLR